MFFNCMNDRPRLKDMYKLFTQVSSSHNNVIQATGYSSIARSYMRDLDEVVSYYNNRVFAIESQHLLCRIINNSSAPLEYVLDRYMEVIAARSPYVGKLHMLTSEITFGKIHNGIFFGSGNPEIIIYNEEYFNPFEALKNWRSLRPVQVLEHPFSDLNMVLPDGENSRSDTGLCVISINIPMLMVQYRGFVEDQMAHMNDKPSLLGVTHFVKMYVLPGMLASYVDIAVMNRLVNIFYGAPMTENYRKLPIPIVHYETTLDRGLSQILEHIEGANIAYSAMLKNIPTVSAADGQTALQMPDLTPTMQVWWALYLARLREIEFLINVGGSKGLAYNGTLIAQMKVDIKRLQNSPAYPQLLDKNMCFDVMETFKTLLSV